MKEKIYWTTRNGEKIDIDKMSLNHLRNTLKMIVRNNQQIPSHCPHNIDDALDLEPYAFDYLWK